MALMDAAFLADDLKKVDPDRHLLGFFAPRAARPALWALFLLRHEIAKTRDVVSDTRLGHIRLQWWRDEISKIYAGQDTGQIPVLSALAPTIKEKEIPFSLFEEILHGREFDLEDVAPASVEGLRNYADFTNTPVTKIALKIIDENVHPDEIRRISTIFGLQEIVRRVPLYLSHRRCYLPADLLAQKNLTPERIMDFNHKAEIVETIKTIVSFIGPYRKSDSVFLERTQRMAFIYLEQLAKNNFDVFSAKMHSPPPFFALRMALPFRT